MILLQKNDLNREKIKVKLSQIFLTLISTLKEAVSDESVKMKQFVILKMFVQ